MQTTIFILSVLGWIVMYGIARREMKRLARAKDKARAFNERHYIP